MTDTLNPARRQHARNAALLSALGPHYISSDPLEHLAARAGSPRPGVPALSWLRAAQTNPETTR